MTKSTKRTKAPELPGVHPQNTPPCQSNFDLLADGAFVREAQLVQSRKRPGVPVLLPFSAQTLWRKVAAKTFPPPVKLSSKVTAWNVRDIRNWISAQTQAVVSE